MIFPYPPPQKKQVNAKWNQIPVLAEKEIFFGTMISRLETVFVSTTLAVKATTTDLQHRTSA